jgi:hypothetical protein
MVGEGCREEAYIWSLNRAKFRFLCYKQFLDERCGMGLCAHWCGMGLCAHWCGVGLCVHWCGVGLCVHWSGVGLCVHCWFYKFQFLRYKT